MFSIIKAVANRKPIASYLRSTAGNLTLIGSIAALPMIASVGLAVDYMRASRSAQELQQIADAAALAAASAKNITGTAAQKIEQRSAIATKFITASVANVADVELVGPPEVTTGPNTVDIHINAKVKGSFINVLNAMNSSADIGGDIGSDVAGESSSKDIDLTVHAKVGFSENSYRCLIALHPTLSQEINFEGNSEFMANCAVHANSNAAVAIRTWGSAEAYATSFCARGGWAGSGFTPDPTGGCTLVADPYASMTLPTVGSCITAAAAGLPSSGSGSKLTAAGAFVKNEARTLPPGTYCGGIEGKTHATITLEKGIYVFKDGDLVLDAGSKILATSGTVIYLTGVSSNISVASGATLKVTGPNNVNSVVGDPTYAYRGWAILQDRTTTPTSDNSVSSQNNGDVDIIGGYYGPTQDLRITANGDVNANSGYFPMITNSLYMTGNATFYVNLDYAAANLDEPTGLKQSSRVAVTQ
jgi:Flp pilus assembly protein TadG